MRRSIITRGRAVFAVGAVAAMGAAFALPGAASAAGQGSPSASVTRAVLIQTDASGKDVSRATLVTQIQVDGSGDLNLEVPTVEGAPPSNMDGFGGPTVENGAAVYNLTVNGPETSRTSQSFDVADVPVRVTVTAKLDGRTIPVTDLQGVTGEVELNYTAENLTSTPTEITYPAGPGPKTEEVDLSTAMGGTLDIVFPPSWTNVKSAEATVITGDGSGDVSLNAGYTLFEPFGEPKQTVTITADATDANLPPAVARFSLLEPKNNPTARALSQSLAGGAESGQTIYDGGAELNDGAQQLVDGLGAAVPGSAQLADGIANELSPGIDQLVTELKNLPATVRAQPDFAVITGGFDTLNAAVGGVRDKLGVFTSKGAGQFLKADGTIDKARTDAARTLWALIYGVRATDTPPGSPTGTPSESTGGLTNPLCDVTDATSDTQPCGAWQLIGVMGAQSKGSSQAVIGAAKALGCVEVLPGLAIACPGNKPLADTLNKSLQANFVVSTLGGELQKKLTTDPAGNPDPSTANGNTATGILNELRAALALGGVGGNGVPGKCEGYNRPGDPSSGLNTGATTAQVTSTCAAADVLNVGLLVSGALEEGVSTTLLDGISATLVEGVQPLVAGAALLKAGSAQLADGLPAALDGVTTVRDKAAASLLESGAAATADFGRQVALYDAMNNPELVAKYLPGGLPTGDNVRSNGAFVYELAGVGSQGTNTTVNWALGVVGLLGVGGLGIWAANRRSAGV
jgi:putative membrane protein